ncbi:MAG: permease [Firmicutes bacterium]|nr:permease [Bacillota bacterium]
MNELGAVSDRAKKRNIKDILRHPELKSFALLLAIFLGAYFIPFGDPSVGRAILEGFYMLQEYAREHVLSCLIPALFIAGAISNFISQGNVIRYLGAQAPKWLTYSVASVAGAVLAVCSCTILPLFAGIYRRGAGIGPATAFLYSGPAVNVLAIILTGRILGWRLGLARAVGAVLFSVLIGLIMAALYGKEDPGRNLGSVQGSLKDAADRSGGQNLIFFITLVFVLIFAAWGKPSQPVGFWSSVFAVKWYLIVGLLMVLGCIFQQWFDRRERLDWLDATWGFAKQILPLLFGGVLVAGILMGRPETDAGLIPSKYVASLLGGNSLRANLLASVVGAFMYMATLTEVPILQGLIGSGMGQGPALALLLSGPALSLPSMLVIRSVLGTRKTVTFISLVVLMATISGMIFGLLVP